MLVGELMELLSRQDRYMEVLTDLGEEAPFMYGGVAEVEVISDGDEVFVLLAASRGSYPRRRLTREVARLAEAVAALERRLLGAPQLRDAAPGCDEP